MIPVLLVAALLLAPVAPARGEPGDPYVALVHVHGWNRLITPLSGAGDWYYDAARHDVAFTLAAGDRVEVRWGGTCTVDGEPEHRSSLFHDAVCYGRGG